MFGYEPLGYFTGDGWVKIYRKLEGGREGGREKVSSVGTVGIIGYGTHFRHAGIAGGSEVCIITE